VKLWAWVCNHKALLAALLTAAALVLSGQYEAAIGVALAALSGGVKPVPPTG
jgi:hypothetical protein